MLLFELMGNFKVLRTDRALREITFLYMQLLLV